MPEDGPLLLADQRLPHLGVLWSDQRRLEFLNQRVAPALLPGEAVIASRLGHLTYRPGRQCISLVDADLASGRQEAFVVTFTKDDRLAAVFAGHYAAPPACGKALHIPELRCLVERFPCDWRLATLSRLFEPPELADLLACVSIQPDGQPAILTYRPHEACVLTGCAVSGGRFVLKVLEGPGRMDHLEAVSAALQSGLRSDLVWTPAVQRLGPQVVAMAHAPGPDLRLALETAAPEQAARLMRLAALALSKLHSLPPLLSARGRLDLPRGLEHARARCARLRAVAPSLAAEAADLLDIAGSLLPAATDETWFVHGDFKASQLLADGGRIAVIDLDSAGAGDRSVDIGNFLADLHRDAALSDNDDLRAAGRVFLEAYAEQAGDAAFLRPALLFRVIALVRMAAHSFRQCVHTYDVARRQDFAPVRLLQEARRCLQEL